MQENNLQIQDIDFSIEEVESEELNKIDTYADVDDGGGAGACCCCIRINCN